MRYRFRCDSCGADEEREISMADYDREKNRQRCACGSVMRRVIEWQGSATNLGGYSDTAGSASWQNS